jgi:hypothetical protein
MITCDDGNGCTADACVDGACLFTPISCDDGDACTADRCDPAGGCMHEPVSCDDGDACTTDSCDPASGCVHGPTTCDDGNPCTTDTCDPATGCVYTAVDCNDGDDCTVDTCIDGVCQSSLPTDFDGNGTVEMGDYELMFHCMAVSDHEGVADGCTCMDLNDDGVINLTDYGLFQCTFGGPQ